MVERSKDGSRTSYRNDLECRYKYDHATLALVTATHCCKRID